MFKYQDIYIMYFYLHKVRPRDVSITCCIDISSGVMWVGGEQDTSGLPRAWSRHTGRVRSGYTGESHILYSL